MFLGGTLLLGLSLWWLAHSTGKSLNRLSGELRSRNEHDSADALNLPPCLWNWKESNGM